MKRQCKTREKTKGGEKKKERQGVGECRKGRPSPDTFLSSSLYKVKHCPRFIAVKRKVNHIINKKKNPITVYGGAALGIIKVSLARPLPQLAAQLGRAG